MLATMLKQKSACCIRCQSSLIDIAFWRQGWHLESRSQATALDWSHWDIEFCFDLLNAKHQAPLWQYLKRHKPFIVLAGPPSTAMYVGASSIELAILKVELKHVPRWSSGTLDCSDLPGLAVLQPTLPGEHPIASAIGSFHCFQVLLAHPNVHTVVLDQCLLALVDSDSQQ